MKRTGRMPVPLLTHFTYIGATASHRVKTGMFRTETRSRYSVRRPAIADLLEFKADNSPLGVACI